MRAIFIVSALVFAASAMVYAETRRLADSSTPAAAPPQALTIAVAQSGSPRRFGTERSKLFVLISNVSDKPQRIWQRNSWGADMIEIEIFDLNGTKLGTIGNGRNAWSPNWAGYDTIAPGEHQVNAISYEGGPDWVLKGDGFKSLKRGAAHKVRVRAHLKIDETKEGKKIQIWTGHIESLTVDLELWIRADSSRQ